MKRIAVAVLATAFLAGSGAAAAAAEPANPACLGVSISAAAHSGADFAAFVSSIARFSPVHGVGDEVQITLAGETADVDFPNACND